MPGVLFAHLILQLFALYLNLHFLGYPLLIGLEEVELVLVDVVNTFELRPLVDGPGEWAYMDLQLLLQLVEQVEGVASLAIHLVDEDDDGRLAHAAYLHQLPCLCLHTFGAIDNDNGRVNGGQRAEGVFGKVLVPRRVEDVDFIIQIVEFHDRCGDRDATLLLYVHPVARGRLAYLVALDGSRHLYLPAEKQELFGQSGLSCVGVADDGECPSAFYLIAHN